MMRVAADGRLLGGTPRERILARLGEAARDPSACWIWPGTRISAGYGWLVVGGVRMYAHRAMLAAEIGRDLGADEVACHRCDNPPCCNPAHLFAGRQIENVRDCRSKGRNARGETNGHAKLTAAAVAEIRARCAAGEKQGEIAERFGVAQQHVSSVHRRKAWAHLPEA